MMYELTSWELLYRPQDVLLYVMDGTDVSSMAGAGIEADEFYRMMAFIQ